MNSMWHSDLALGTSSLGAGTSDGDPAPVRTALALLRSGLTVDTSRAYASGRSERALGAALSLLTGAEHDRAADLVVTKVDADPITGALDADRVRRSLDESLTALGLSRVRLLHLHDPYTVTFEQATGARGAVEGMLALRDEGLVDAIGIAAGPVPLVDRYVRTGAFDAVLVHNRYTLVDRSAIGVWHAARKRGMTVVNAAPFGGGLLATGAVPGARYAYRPAPAGLVAWVARAEALCTRHGITLPAAALAFSLRDPLVDVTVVRASSPRRLREVETLRSTAVPDEFWDELDQLGPAPSPIDDTRGAA